MTAAQELNIQAVSLARIVRIAAYALAPIGLIVEPGGQLVAVGNATAPITFTALEVVNQGDTATLEWLGGLWAGVVVYGRAPSAQPLAVSSLEVRHYPLNGVTTNATDFSGVLPLCPYLARR